MRKLGRPPAIALALMAVAAQAVAQERFAVEEVVRTIQGLVADGRLARVVAELSAPLSYESQLGPLNPHDRTDPRNLDVAGVRLGMRPGDVKSALRQSGYQLGAEEMQVSYDSRVRQEWRDMTGIDTGRSSLVVKSQSWTKGDERISVDFVAMPDGAAVSWVSYSGYDQRSISPEVFEAELLRKYGEPVNPGLGDMRWCTLKAPSCEDPRYAQYPVLEASAEMKRIWLAGPDADRDVALKARFSADIMRKAKPSAASF